MLDHVVILLGKLGWLEYAETKCISYDRLMVEFLTSLNVDWVDFYGDQEVLISF